MAKEKDSKEEKPKRAPANVMPQQKAPKKERKEKKAKKAEPEGEAKG